MDFTKSLEKKAHVKMQERQGRRERVSHLQSVHGQFFQKVRSDLKRLPNRSDPLVRNQ